MYLVIDGNRLYVATGRGVPAVFDPTGGKFLSLNLQPNTSLGGTDVVGLGDWFFNSGAVFGAASQTLVARTGLAAALHPDYVVFSGSKPGRRTGTRADSSSNP